MDDETLALLALMAEQGGRPSVLARALLVAGSAWGLSLASGWAPKPAAWRRAARQGQALAALGITAVPVYALPPRLMEVRPRAPALFVRGPRELLERPAVAVVGARKASPGPLAYAGALAASAARAGWLVVSGGARGIDAAAHMGALTAGAATAAYLGVPADRVYPATHRELFERVLAAGGALVSEHAPLARTFAAAHAMRNRWIAGHASRVVVVEAATASGSLGTALHARRRGIPVLVPPPEIGGERGGIEALCAAGAAHVLASPEMPPHDGA